MDFKKKRPQEFKELVLGKFSNGFQKKRKMDFKEMDFEELDFQENSNGF